MDAAGDWNMNNDAIGVFDSGIGGLTAVKALRALMPNENIIYFGDTARIPYGSRSRETVLKYANEDIAFLRKFPIKMIIAACGTVSTILGTKSPVTDMPFTGVLLPSVQAACGATRNGASASSAPLPPFAAAVTPRPSRPSTPMPLWWAMPAPCLCIWWKTATRIGITR